MNYSTRNQRIRNLGIFGPGALAIVLFPILLSALALAPAATGVALAMPSLWVVLSADIKPFERQMQSHEELKKLNQKMDALVRNSGSGAGIQF